MVTNGDNQDQPSGRFGTHKEVVIGPPGHAERPILNTTEETFIGQDVLETTTVEITRCRACGRAIHNEAEVGGVCGQCNGVLCCDCTQRRCIVCGHCLCRTCSLDILGSVYCRPDGSRQLASWALAVLIAIGLVGGLMWLVLNFVV